MRSSVVFPEPFGPSTTQCSPDLTVQLTWSTIVMPASRRVTDVNSNSGPPTPSTLGRSPGGQASDRTSRATAAALDRP